MAFPNETALPAQQRDAALERIDQLEADKAALEQELSELQSQMSGFVKGNIDNMLAWRSLKERSAELQAEVDVLAAANNQLNQRVVDSEIRERHLQVRLRRSRRASTLTQGI